MLKVFGNSLSQPCNKVRYCCNILAVPYEWVSLDFAAHEHKSPEHLARHPAGKLPAIDDDGFTLFESDAICRYLIRKHGAELIPGELKAYAIMEQWNAFAISHVGLAMSKVLFNRIVAPTYKLPVDENSLKEGLSWLERYLPIIETRLSVSPFFGGDALSLADITLLALLDPAERGDVDLAGFSAISRWRTTLQAEAWWRDAHAE